MKPVVIALDQGSSSSRAIAFNERGQAVAKAQFPVSSRRPKPGWVEHDALDLAATQERALDAVLGQLTHSCPVAGLAMACQRSTIVAWDAATGEPAAPALSWQDGRAAQDSVFLQRNREFWRRATGLYPTPYYSALKLRWLLQNNKRVEKLAASGRLMAGPVATFILWRLSRGAIFAADPTLAQRTLLMNIQTLSWDKRLLDSFGITHKILPDIVPSVGLWGLIRRQGREIPVLACLGDQQAAVAGLGGRKENAVIANYGTGAFLLRACGARPRFIPGLPASVGWTETGHKALYFEEGTVNAAGAALDWLARLGLAPKNAAIDEICRRATSDVLSLPALGGLGAPAWDDSVRASFSGLDAQNTAEDMVKACVEGIAFLIADIAEAMENAGPRIKSVRASGGVSRLDYLMQFQADVLQSPVHRLLLPDATALGAASLALRRHHPSWSARLQEARVERTFIPKRSAKESARLRARWKNFLRAQLALARPAQNS